MCPERDKLFSDYGTARRTLHEASQKLRGAAKGAGSDVFDSVWEEVQEARRVCNAARDAFLAHVDRHGCDGG